jgi:proteasome lid subunit RPN8/RPN11
MRILIRSELLDRIASYGEESYPEETAGFLLGTDGVDRVVHDLIHFDNTREVSARRTRYFIGPKEYLQAELEADRRGLGVVGVFHSHPDHPNSPSEFDREWAQPQFSYVITSVGSGRAEASRCWRLEGDRGKFVEEEIQITE